MNINRENFLNSMTVIFEFTEEEDDAIHGFIPMTQEIFDSCMEKCEKIGPRVDKTYQKLIEKYPEFFH